MLLETYCSNTQYVRQGDTCGLDAIIDGLSKQCGELLNRLEPVLRSPDADGQAIGPDCKPAEMLVPLAARIRTSADFLGNISSGVEHMINSIEL